MVWKSPERLLMWKNDKNVEVRYSEFRKTKWLPTRNVTTALIGSVSSIAIDEL